jgi:hypothetical protein
MKEKNTGHLLYFSPIDEEDSVIEEITKLCSEEDTLQTSRGIAFSGGEFREIALVLGTSGAIAAIAKVIVAWLESKKSRVVKINGREIRGYSVEDVVRILEMQRRADKK